MLAESCYDQGRYLQAGKHLEGITWTRDVLKSLGPEAVLFLARLTPKLGSRTLWNYLFRFLKRNWPDHPAHRCYRGAEQFATFYEYLQDLEKNEDWRCGNAVWDMVRLTAGAEYWLQVRDFERSSRYLRLGFELVPEDPWLTSVAGLNSLEKGDLEEAKRLAEKAWDLRPGLPSTAWTLSRVYDRLGLFEAFERKVAPLLNTDHAGLDLLTSYLNFGIKTLEHISRRSDLPDKNQTFKTKALELFNISLRLEQVAPLAGRKEKRGIRAMQGHIARCGRLWDQPAPYLEQFDLKPEQVEQAREGRLKRVVLPYTPIYQEHNTCFPAALATSIGTMGLSQDPEQLHLELVQRFTYGGTTTDAVIGWAKDNGLASFQFTVTKQLAQQLIDKGIPFIILLSFANQGHASTVVGYDQVFDTLLVHDPQGTGLREINTDFWTDFEAPLGPEGLVVVEPALADWVEDLSLTDRHLREAVGNFNRELYNKDLVKAEKALEKVRRTKGTQALIEECAFRFLQAKGSPKEALKIVEKLWQQNTSHGRLQQQLLHISSGLADQTHYRNCLEAMANFKPVPGYELDQEKFIYPEVEILFQHYQILLLELKDLNAAHAILQKAHAFYPTTALTYFMEAMYQEALGLPEHMLFPLEIAVRLEPEHQFLLTKLTETLQEIGREDEIIPLLNERAQSYRGREVSNEPWISLVVVADALMGKEQATQFLDQALADKPLDGELACFAVAFFLGSGDQERIEPLLRIVNQYAGKRNATRIACQIADFKKDTQKAEAALDELIRLEPLDLEHRTNKILCVLRRAGDPAARELITSWLEEMPDQAVIQNLEIGYDAQFGSTEQVCEKVREYLPQRPKDLHLITTLLNRYEQRLNHCLVRDKDRELAEMKDYLSAIEDVADPVIIRTYQAVILQHEGREDEALSLFKTSFEEAVRKGDHIAPLLKDYHRLNREARDQRLQYINHILRTGKPDPDAVTAFLGNLMEVEAANRVETQFNHWSPIVKDHFGFDFLQLQFHFQHRFNTQTQRKQLENQLQALKRRYPDNFDLAFFEISMCRYLGQSEKAFTGAQTLHRRNPLDPELLEVLVQLARTHEEHDLVFDHLETLIYRQPMNWTFHNEYITGRHQAFGDSVHDYWSALHHRFPNHVEPLYFLAANAMSEGAQETAMTFAQRIKDCNLRSSTAVLALSALFQDSESPEHISFCKKTLDQVYMDPYPDQHFVLRYAEQLFHFSDNRKATKVLQELRDFGPPIPHPDLLEGSMYLKEHQYAARAELILHCLEQHPGELLCWKTLIQFLDDVPDERHHLRKPLLEFSEKLVIPNLLVDIDLAVFHSLEKPEDQLEPVFDQLMTRWNAAPEVFHFGIDYNLYGGLPLLALTFWKKYQAEQVRDPWFFFTSAKKHMTEDRMEPCLIAAHMAITRTGGAVDEKMNRFATDLVGLLGRKQWLDPFLKQVGKSIFTRDYHPDVLTLIARVSIDLKNRGLLLQIMRKLVQEKTDVCEPLIGHLLFYIDNSPHFSDDDLLHLLMQEQALFHQIHAINTFFINAYHRGAYLSKIKEWFLDDWKLDREPFENETLLRCSLLRETGEYGRVLEELKAWMGKTHVSHTLSQTYFETCLASQNYDLFLQDLEKWGHTLDEEDHGRETAFLIRNLLQNQGETKIGETAIHFLDIAKDHQNRLTPYAEDLIASKLTRGQRFAFRAAQNRPWFAFLFKPFFRSAA